MSIQHALALPAPAPSNTVVINARCSLRIEADQRVIVVAGLPVHHYRAEDAVAEAYAMVSLVEAGFAQQTDVAQAFERSARTIRRYQEHYGDDGMAALGREEGWRRGRRRISGKRLRSIEMLKSQGMSNRAIAQRLGVTENAIRKLIGPSKPATDDAQLALAGIPTAAGKPAESGVPSATPSSENADRTALPTGGHAGDRHSMAAPEAADDDDPVPMSGEVREPGRSLELVEEVPQQWGARRELSRSSSPRHHDPAWRQADQLAASGQHIFPEVRSSARASRCRKAPAISPEIPHRPPATDRARDHAPCHGLAKPRSKHAQYHHGCQPKTRDDSLNLYLVAQSRL
jgi:transposase